MTQNGLTVSFLYYSLELLHKSRYFGQNYHDQSYHGLSCNTRFNFDTKFWIICVSEPNFVGSYDIGENVLFFFRETAVEYINCGKSVYSRVARVCKKDTGGKNILSQNWATYLKARLNCSIPGEFPFYFNEIRKFYLPLKMKTNFM